MLRALTDTAEDHYVKALADPFHPMSSGCRVPELVPRETLTYTSFGEIASGIHPNPTPGEVLLSAFHPVGDFELLKFEAALANDLMNNTVLTRLGIRKSAEFTVNYISIG